MIMYKLVKKLSAHWMDVHKKSVFVIVYDGDGVYTTYLCSWNGVFLKKIKFRHRKYASIPELYRGLWFVHYTKKSPLVGTMNIFSLDGELKQSIMDVATYFDMLPTEDSFWVYLVDKHLIRYNLSTHEYQDLGTFPLESAFFYKGSHRGLHFFISDKKSQLVAMRDKDGQGLEEVYRLDFSESGRGYSLWYNEVVPGEIDFINFYGSDLWVTTQEHLHRIDVATGKVLERKDEALPKMFIKGSLGYSLFNSYYTVFDFEAGRMLCNVRRDRFVYEGKEYSAEYTSLLLHEGIFYVSVRVSGIFFLAAFDVQTEEFVWHDLWGGWNIDSVHIVDDRMIAHAYDEVRIYQRVSPTTGASGDDSKQESQVGLQWSQDE